MEYFKFLDKASVLAFLAKVNDGEGFVVSNNSVTTGYTKPIEFTDGFYVVADAITKKYSTSSTVIIDTTYVSRTPPASNGKGIILPEKYHWVFKRNNKLTLNGFEVELKTLGNGSRYVEDSGLDWAEFIAEFDKTPNSDYWYAVVEIWQYALTQRALGNAVTI